MDKKGFLRLVEAVIAIMIIIGVVLVISVRNKPVSEVDLTDSIPPYLDEIAKDSDLRERIVQAIDNTELDSIEDEIKDTFLKERIKNPSIGYDVAICDPPDILCPLEPYPSDASRGVFAGEAIVSSVLPKYGPKKVKIYLWIKK